MRKRTFTIDKQVLSVYNYSSIFYVSNPKTDSSNRTIPIAEDLLDDLKKYHEELLKFKNFTDELYVFGNDSGFRPLDYKQAQQEKEKLQRKLILKKSDYMTSDIHVPHFSLIVELLLP